MTMSLRSLAARALLPRYAAGALGPRASTFVQSALAADPSLAKDYDALRRAEALTRASLDATGAAAAAGAAAGTVPGAGAALSAGQLDAIEARLLAQLGASGSAPVQRAPARFSFARATAPLALAAACAALFVVVGDREGSVSGDADGGFAVGALEARGAKLAREPLGLRVSCVVDGAVVGDATAGARRGTDVLECPPGALLAFATTNLSPEARYAFVVGVARDGALRWYAPFKRGAPALTLSAGEQQRVVDEMADTRGMADDPSVSLHVLFSDEPFTSDDVERQLALARARGVPLASIDRLPLVDVPLQARIDLRRP